MMPDVTVRKQFLSIMLLSIRDEERHSKWGCLQRVSATSMYVSRCYSYPENGRHFPDDVIKWIFFNENVLILINNSLKFVPDGPINNIPALVQIMAWRRPGDKPLSEPMMVRLPTHICALGLNELIVCVNYWLHVFIAVTIKKVTVTINFVRSYQFGYAVSIN